ncbi:MAG: ribonuclease P protein component [Hylemonella sp.]
MQPKRLKNREQFQAVLACAPVARTEHFAMHSLELGAGVPAQPAFAAPGPWIGALVPKRWARRAVTRNLIRRQVYALAASSAGWLPQCAYVVRLRSAFDLRQFPSASSDALKMAVRTELQRLFQRAACPVRPAA